MEAKSTMADGPLKTATLRDWASNGSKLTEPDTDRFLSKWTVFEEENCKGRSALLPVYEGEYADWRDYAET